LCEDKRHYATKKKVAIALKGNRTRIIKYRNLTALKEAFNIEKIASYAGAD
jgi:hypothetical protein